MCGIVGIAAGSPVREQGRLAVQRDSLRHRGPDDAGIWWSEDGHVGLAHRRLAIIDLSPGGRQPMTDESGRFCIVFNGEIYNFLDLRKELEDHGHLFHTHSDTEVLLKAYRQWGVECLGRLNGMFAFGLYDALERRLFLARDRAGEKPLFYSLQRGTLSFASELKALAADPYFPRHIDYQALDCYLAFGYVPGERCILDGVNKLPPAHACTFDVSSGRLRTWRYWQLPDSPEGNGAVSERGRKALVDELEYLLEDAARRHLVADVPVGILLSGGLDSSLVTAMAARSTANVKTFTIRFPGSGRHDETEHARLIARCFETDHEELVAEPSTVELLPNLAIQFDEPVADSSMIPTYLVTRLVRRHCTVALGGDGGDELFGGYAHYSRLLRFNDRLGWIPFRFRKTVADLASSVLPLGFKGRNFLQELGVDLATASRLNVTLFDRASRKSLLNSRAPDSYASIDAAKPPGRPCVPHEADLVQRATRDDFINYLPEDILVKVDRTSMLNSLEVRAPWLDYRIIEFAFGKVPHLLKATANERKILPKLLAGRLLPPGFDLQRKQGFSIPLKSWVRGPEWGPYFREVLLESDGSVFNRAFVLDLITGEKPGRSNGGRLFALVLFELWRREYRVSG